MVMSLGSGQFRSCSAALPLALHNLQPTEPLQAPCSACTYPSESTLAQPLDFYRPEQGSRYMGASLASPYYPVASTESESGSPRTCTALGSAFAMECESVGTQYRIEGPWISESTSNHVSNAVDDLHAQ